MPSSLKAAVSPSSATARFKGPGAAESKNVSRPAQTRADSGRSTDSVRPLPAFAAAAAPLAPLRSPAIPRPGGGQPLPAHILDALQNSLGVDLSPIRLHTGTAWQKRTWLLNARAFTFGPDIFIGPGENPANLALLAHETAHVLQQQSKPRIQTKSAVRDNSMEQEADQAAIAAENQQGFLVKQRVLSENGEPKNVGSADAHIEGQPGAHDAKAKPGQGAAIRVVERKGGAALAEGQSNRGTAERHGEAAEKKEKEIPDNDAIAQLRGNWAALPLEIATASSLTIAFDATSSLELYPKPAPPGTPGATSQADQNRIVRDAVEEYSGFHRQAGSAHSEVAAKSNDIRRGIVEKGRDTLHHVDQVLNIALDGAASALAAGRLMIDDGAHSALEALDHGEAAARVQLWGASAGAHQRIAQVKLKTGETIEKIEADLRSDFEKLYSSNAKAIGESGKSAAERLNSPAVHSEVQQSIQDSAEAKRAAEVEAERASVPRYLVDVAKAITDSCKAQVDWLNTRISTPKGHSVDDAITEFGEKIKTAAIGDGPGGAPQKGVTAKSDAPADASRGTGPADSAPARSKGEPLYAQANHAVDHAYSQAIQSLRSQVAAARKSIEAARRSAQEQFSAQRTAVFAQLTNVRQAHVTNLQHATANAINTVEDGARSALAMYPESCRSVARSLQGAAQKGPRELEQTARSGVADARQSLEAAHSIRIKRLEQVGDDARGALAQQGAQAGEASSAIKDSFTNTLNLIAFSTSKSMSDSVIKQVQGFKGLSAGIAAASAQFTQPLDKLFKKAIDDAREKTFKPILEGETKSVEAAAKEACTKFENQSHNPIETIQDRLKNVSETLSKSLAERAQKAMHAWGIVFLDQDALMASMRGVTAKQGAALEQSFLDQSARSLRARLKYEYDDWPGGLNKDQYNACIDYLNGNTAKGALNELKTAKGWFSSDSKKAEDVMRALTPSERADAEASPEWGSVATKVRDGLSGDDLKVFDALATSEVALADAIRLRQHVKEAKENNDKDALFKALENYHPGGDPEFLATVRSDVQANQQAAQAAQLQQGGLPATPEQRQTAIGKTDQVSFADVQQEFAKIEPPAAPAPGETAKTPAEVLAAYVLKPVKVEIPNDDGPSTTVTYTVEGPDAVLARTLAMEGPGTVNSKAARLYRESERKGEKPDFEQLENAVVDPRLNKALPQGRDLNEDQRKQVRAEQDQIFLAYAKLLKDNNATTQEITDPKKAREMAAEHLSSHFDLKDTKEAIGAQYAASLVTQDVPDTVAALRYAQLGWGTDEDLIHRTLQRMSRADIDEARVKYQKAYGTDLYADLGLYGKGTFGELSGDDRLQAEREAMGVPQNDREAAEVALFTNLQQEKETGWVGKHLVGGGEAAALERNEQRLRQMAGGDVGQDDLGRPAIPENSKNFDEKGKYIGGDSHEFSRELTMAQITAENYQASIDQLTTAITTAIAIIGAVVATVVTLGAGAPLLAAVLIAGATGLASMGASYAIKGGRYGWEQALTDLGMTGVQMLTAGVGASLGAAAKGAEAVTEAAEAVEVAEEAGTAAAKTASKAPGFGQMVKTGAITGGIGGMGSAALDERTWKDGIGAGFGRVFLGGARGAFGGAVGAGVSGALEHIPLGGNTLGNLLHENTLEGAGLLEGGKRMLLGGLGRSLVSSAGGVGGRAGELLFDEATGQYHGTMKDALVSLAEAGEQPLLQGFLEGAAHPVAKSWADRKQAMRAAQAEPGNREDGRQLHEPESGSSRRPEEELQGPPALEHETPPAHPGFENAAALGALSAGTGVPAIPIPPESETVSMPKEPVEAAGGGEGGMHPPGGGTPPPSSGGEPLFPNLTDAEIDALFGQATSGPMVEVRGAKTLDESLGLRLPAAQGGTYWGLDPATGMTVQEYRFLSERGLPAVDSKGDPIPGPRGNKMTKMRIHSPDPTAPIGSASHEGWTMSFEQGEHLRMTADGVWFDRRYGSMPDGSQLDVRPYRRGPAGDWVESSTGRPVTDADHRAALDDWDHKMASSHIPLFPEAHPEPTPPSALPTPPPAPRTGGVGEQAQPEPTPQKLAPEAETGEPQRSGLYDKAAAGIADSRFAGDAAERFNLPAAKSPDAAIENVVEVKSPVSRFAKLVREDGQFTHVELETKSADRSTGKPAKVNVRFEMVDSLPREDGIMPVAKYDPTGENTYVVRISKGAPEAVLERAIAHELTEIRAVHGAVDVPEVHALTPESNTTRLTPHDEGRLAEVGVLANQLSKAKGADRVALLDDAQKLAEHLGLTGNGKGADARRALAFEHLGDGAAQKWLKIAIALPEENPFRQRLQGNLRRDLGTLAKRIELSQEFGDLPSDRDRWTKSTPNPIVRDAVEIMRESLIRDGVVELRYGKPGYVDPILVSRIRQRLGPVDSVERLVFEDAFEEAKQPSAHKRAVPDPHNLDPSTAEATRAAFGKHERFLDWQDFKGKYIERNPGVVEPDPANRGEMRFKDPLRARTLFDDWASGSQIDEDTGKVRSLLSDETGPTKGYEPTYAKKPTALLGLELAKELEVRPQQNKIALNDAAKERFRLLDEASTQRTALKKAELVGDEEAARAARAKIEELMDPAKNISEAFGMAAGRALAAKDFPNAEVFESSGARVFDLVLKVNGEYVIIECKGGDSPLKSRLSWDKSIKVQQGTREYVMAVANDYINSGNPQFEEIGRHLFDNLMKNPDYRPKYYEVRQGFDAMGRPTPPVVGEFDMKPNKPAIVEPTDPAQTGKQAEPEKENESKK
ncbi:MAG: DUF4157 domain-containing protein [Terracidiphilus sp.]